MPRFAEKLPVMIYFANVTEDLIRACLTSLCTSQSAYSGYNTHDLLLLSYIVLILQTLLI